MSFFVKKLSFSTGSILNADSYTLEKGLVGGILYLLFLSLCVVCFFSFVVVVLFVWCRRDNKLNWVRALRGKYKIATSNGLFCKENAKHFAGFLRN